MATLILSTVGYQLGGPIGSAIGAVIGQRIDQEIFKPKGRQGPRLGDLAVQTSSYGTAIPKLFGTLRVAGTVIWADDLKETRSRSGGKGRPSVTSYSYAASFAVALSARPVRAVRRIWADGNLLRGEAGDFKTGLAGFRLHLGSEDQSPDPLIASAEADTPAYRGIACAVFEGLELADYGNRIPSLTFEVEADPGPVTLHAIAAELSGGAVTGADLPSLGGYAALGDSVRGAVETLAAAAPLVLRDDGAALRLIAPATAAAALTADEIVAPAREATQSRERGRPAPTELSIAYHDAARDYQAGLQHARRGGPGGRSERIELPAVLGAPQAKAIAEGQLARAWRERTRRVVRVPWSRLALRPGDLVTLPDAPGQWRIAALTVERRAVELRLVPHRLSAAVPVPAEPGRVTREPDRAHGPTVLHLFELPDMGDLHTQPRLHAAAAGPSPGWRRAALSLSRDGGASWTELGPTAAPAIIGSVVTAPGPGFAPLLDAVNFVNIELLHTEMALEDADDARLLAGANLALVGGELIQFGRAEPLGDARWRLSRLLRGRFGTEHAAALPGERFVLIERESLVAIDLPGGLGAEARVMAAGIGDPDGVVASAVATGLSVRPPSSVALTAIRTPDGGASIVWTRRGRAGWRWSDGADAPLGEERERYRVTVRRGAAILRTVEVDAPVWTLPPADLAGGAVTVAVAQLGTLAASLDTEIVIQP